MTAASYRDGWERIFGPRPKPYALTNPFPLRPDFQASYTIPSDFKLRDLRRLVRHLALMCDDYEPEMGWAEVTFAQPCRKGSYR